jgi:hypothetical protein
MACTCKRRVVRFKDGNGVSVPNHVVVSFMAMMEHRIAELDGESPEFEEALALTLSEAFASGFREGQGGTKDLEIVLSDDTVVPVTGDVH